MMRDDRRAVLGLVAAVGALTLAIVAYGVLLTRTLRAAGLP